MIIKKFLCSQTQFEIIYFIEFVQYINLIRFWLLLFLTLKLLYFSTSHNQNVKGAFCIDEKI